MKKIKKLLSMVMAMTMVLGMAMTVSAANENGTITVSGLASTGTNDVEYVKILEPDVTADTGYVFATGVTIAGYDTVAAFLGATTSEQQAALTAEGTELPARTDMTVSGTTATATVDAGYYAVFATNTPANEGDPEIVYTQPMILSLEYSHATPATGGGYNYDIAEDQDGSSVVAKYSDIPITKDADSATGEIGVTKTYTITTYIPSDVTFFVLTDTLTGAVYEKGTVSVIIQDEADGNGNIAETTVTYNPATQDTPEQMVITLNDYLEGNAGKLVTITYDVTITATIVNNTVDAEDSADHDYDFAQDRIDTGAIRLMKYGQDDVNEDGENDALNGAKFVVYKYNAEEPSTKEYLKETTTDGVKKYDWVASIDEATRYITGASGVDGEILIEGLDMGTYYFQEVEAPDGYSIYNGTEDTLDVVINEDNLTSEIVPVANPDTVEVTDSKLASLPSTGGIGTTIFTIGGCAIMIAAAALYFVNRRKSEEN